MDEFVESNLSDGVSMGSAIADIVQDVINDGDEWSGPCDDHELEVAYLYERNHRRCRYPCRQGDKRWRKDCFNAPYGIWHLPGLPHSSVWAFAC